MKIHRLTRLKIPMIRTSGVGSSREQLQPRKLCDHRTRTSASSWSDPVREPRPQLDPPWSSVRGLSCVDGAWTTELD